MSKEGSVNTTTSYSEAKAHELGVNTTRGGVTPWLLLYLRLQAELNTLSSVSIEVPALRPAAKALREALGD